MTNDEIKDTFDNNLNMTLSELARISGRTVRELQRILMEDNCGV